MVPSFQYANKGSLAYVGGNKGVAELKSLLWTKYPVASDGKEGTHDSELRVTGS